MLLELAKVVRELEIALNKEVKVADGMLYYIYFDKKDYKGYRRQIDKISQISVKRNVAQRKLLEYITNTENEIS